jgi:hypothetical protein
VVDGPGTVTEEIVLLVVTVTLLCRWVFSSRGVRKGSARPDYGLLSPVLRTDAVGPARDACEKLEVAGIRATVAPAGVGFTSDGHPWPASAHVVLVFPPDLDAAEQVLRPTRSH